MSEQVRHYVCLHSDKIFRQRVPFTKQMPTPNGGVRKFDFLLCAFLVAVLFFLIKFSITNM